MSETDSLLKKEEPKNFYFLNKDEQQHKDDEKHDASHENGQSEQHVSSSTGWFSSFFHRGTNDAPVAKLRKVPVKVEPKVFFANERTFLAWLHMSITLASISMAILAFADANDWSQMYGICLMPVAIGFCAYSLYMYIKRAGMIKRKEPGPYDDRVGPVVLASMLALAIIANFGVKLYDYMQ